MELGIVDDLLFGKDAGHSFLALRDQDSGKIISEIHGYAFDPVKGLFGGMRIDMAAVRDILMAQRHAFGDFNKSAISCDVDRIKLKAYATKGQWRADDEAILMPIGTMSEQQAGALWRSMGALVDKVNERNLDYVMVAPNERSTNCHTVTGLLLDKVIELHPEMADAIRAALADMPYALPGIESKSGDVFMKRSALENVQTSFSGDVLAGLNDTIAFVHDAGLRALNMVSDFKGFQNVPTPACFHPA